MAKIRIPSLVFALFFCSLSFGRIIELPLHLHSRSSAVVENDFENGTTFPWFDSSPSDVHWVVEDFDSPVEPTPAPRPISGSKYLRAYRGSSGSAFGLAVFSSPYFTALPGDTISMDFWIRSQHTGGNSLEVYYEKNGFEERILNLGIFSSPSNSEWRNAAAALPIREPTTLRLVIYGFCGSVLADAIAIDNIVARRQGDNSTTPVVSTTTTTATTTVVDKTTEKDTTQVTESTPANVTSTTTSQNSTTTTSTELDSTTTMTPTVKPGCSDVLYAPNGEIKSANYPDYYSPNSNCSWLLQLPEPYTKINFNFLDFLSESCCDILRIYDGPSMNSSVLLEHRGTYLPTPSSVTSSVRNVLVTFVSDQSLENKGFWIKYNGVY